MKHLKHILLKGYFCSAFSVLLNFAGNCKSGSDISLLSIYDMRTEYRTNPLGIDNILPRFFWKLKSSARNQRQTAYQVLVSQSEAMLLKDSGEVWNSGRVRSDKSLHIIFGGKPLESRKRYYWKIRVWDQDGRITEWSDISWWEMALLRQEDWTARWIEPSFNLVDTQYYKNIVWPEKAKVLDGSQRAALLVKTLKIPKKQVKKARMYTTAKGIYYLYLNGSAVDSDFLKPGWTDYRKRIQYQVFDVTKVLASGRNVIGVELGHGWYAGTVAFYGMHQYGKEISFLLQLEIEFSDNTSMTIVSDESWKCGLSAITANDLIHGESYDATLDMIGWNLPAYDHCLPDWKGVKLSSEKSPLLVASCGPAVKAVREITPVSVTAPANGIFIVDMGQNIAGIARLKVSGKKGHKVQLRFGEILTSDGKPDVSNLYGARQTDIYTLGGNGLEIYKPRFTMHGFRYIEVSGFPGVLTPENVTGVVLAAEIPETGTLVTSDASINQLMRNIHWSFRSNFTYVPTDCPQRIERQGWMGDAGLFASTAAYLGDMSSYFTKWLQDIADSQFDDGAFSDVSPRQLPIDGAPTGGTGGGTNIWGDAGVVIPWVMYNMYGDTLVIGKYYDQMKQWIEYCKRNSRQLIRPDILYGDWLPPKVQGSVPAPHNMVNTAYFAYSTLLMSKMAAATGRRNDELYFLNIFEDIKSSFNRHFVTDDGYFRKGPDDTLSFANQTLYALGLEAELFSSPMIPMIVKNFVFDIKKHGCLTTGIVGTKYINQVLSKFNCTAVAYELLQNRKYPSWLNQVDSGATTIGEHWDSFAHTYTSRNHVALGAVGEWMFAAIGGISADAKIPAYKHVRLKPEPGGGLSFANAICNSIYGPVKCEWRISDARLHVSVEIPANTTASVYLPATDPNLITENGVPVAKVQGVMRKATEAKTTVLNIGSGNYHFSLPFVQ